MINGIFSTGDEHRSGAGSVQARMYYIDPAGSDITGNGSLALPWKTLAYACSQVTSRNSTIFVKAGTYNETARFNLSPGVSVRGTGDTSIINTTYNPGAGTQYDGAFYLVSGTRVNGNQSISFIKLTGTALTSWYALYTEYRHNVHVHHCTIENFRDRGLKFWGNADTTGIYTLNNSVHHCIINNCGDRSTYGCGSIHMEGQEGFRIYDNTIRQTFRAAGSNGNIMSTGDGWNRDIKYYNNVSHTLESNGTQWNFHIEHWDSRGGIEIYDNEFHGGGCYIDCGGYSNTKGAWDYSFYIHDNFFGRASTQPFNVSRESVGVAIEGTSSDIIITRNHFSYCQFGVVSSLAQATRTQERIYINYNLFENIGLTNNDWSGLYQGRLSATDDIIRDLYIDNNVLTVSAAAASGVIAGMLFQQDGDAGQSFSNINIRNNSIQDITEGFTVIYNNTTVASLLSQNNILLNNGNNDDIVLRAGASITSYTNTNNQKTNPLFVGGGDFHLQAGSPGIGAGLNVGLTLDYESDPVNNPPEVGIYSYP